VKSKPLVALILLPQTYNADRQGRRRKIEDEKFSKTMAEMAAQFGGGAFGILGTARHEVSGGIEESSTRTSSR
jgi:hypothetical protein